MKQYKVKIGNWRMPVRAKNENNALAQGIRIYGNTHVIPRGAIASAKRDGEPVFMGRSFSRNTYATVELFGGK